MSPHEVPLGCSGLLRVAGLPIRFWLSGANPELFAKVRNMERLHQEHRAHAINLAERIGDELVPLRALSREDRACLLAVRRRLHCNNPVSEHEFRRVFQIVTHFYAGEGGLLEDLMQAAERDRDLAMLAADLNVEVPEEQARLLRLPTEIVAESPVSGAFLPNGGASNPPNGSGQEVKPSIRQRRRQAEHEWRRVTRAATSSIPRDWLSHVALLPIEAAAPPLSALAVGSDFAAQWRENVRSQSRTLRNTATGWSEPDTPVALAPLYWHEDGRLVVVVLDEDDKPTLVSVRRTPLLDAIVRALTVSVRTVDELAEALGYQNEDRHLLPGFLRHLVTLGILQAITPPRAQLVRRATPGRSLVGEGGTNGRADGWVDVYRRTETSLPATACTYLQWGVSQAMRLFALMSADSPTVLLPPPWSTGRSWSLADILRAYMAADEPPPPHRHSPNSWPPPVSTESGYGRLIRALAEHLDSSVVMDIDNELLDALGASDGALDWPVDCLLRLPAPGAGYAAVLDQLWPPGMVDARFTETLQDLHGRVPQADAYRAFLQRLEETTGVLFVELLAPPLSDRAANAVRRPAYTRAWTGDPHATAYLPHGATPERFIPLSAIRIRRVDGRLFADMDGQPIWPVYHATRSFSPPWDHLARVLFATAPNVSPARYRRLDNPLALFPARQALPRITIAGQIVVSPAQWRLSPNELWDSESPTVAKVRELVRLQERRGLPRWGYLASSADEPSVPYDLESLHAIRAFERCQRSGSPIRLVEMLPPPDGFLVADRAHQAGDRLASELLLRLPCDEAPAAMADRLAQRIFASISLPGTPHGRSPLRVIGAAQPIRQNAVPNNGEKGKPNHEQPRERGSHCEPRGADSGT